MRLKVRKKLLAGRRMNSRQLFIEFVQPLDVSYLVNLHSVLLFIRLRSLSRNWASGDKTTVPMADQSQPCPARIPLKPQLRPNS